ncbi:hypothetical protein J2Y58_000428 [Sphingomonas sp. BE138]|uniref:hypothetical protein n=1 Tax=Sphingomonas sp. BE138 TaxID=2817845 RepID=UPI0028616DBA|nr:hypothetical protein [Sphingomonas sp. BE138]MDR6787090.1 hypothetical protein [Sphingomonas sp. BE138]
MTEVRVPWFFVLIVATVFAVGMALIPRPIQMEVGDKWQHMAAFGTLTLLSVLAFPSASLLRIGERLSFLGAMIEVLQSIPALHRDCDIMDWVADTTIIVGVLVVVRVGREMRGAR